MQFKELSFIHFIFLSARGVVHMDLILLLFLLFILKQDLHLTIKI